MSAVTQPFRPCHAKQATAYLSMAKHDNKNISLLLWYIASRTPNFTFEMANQKKNNRTDELFTFKYSKMLSFSQVAEALTGLIYHRPSGENFSSVITKTEPGIGPSERLLPIFGTKSRILEIGSCERDLSLPSCAYLKSSDKCRTLVKNCNKRRHLITAALQMRFNGWYR